MEDKKEEVAIVDTILLKVVSRCNINCSYCYVYNMGDDNWKHLEKFISSETIIAICDQLLALAKIQKRRFAIVLHGGEPLLLGETKLEYLLAKLRNILDGSYPVSLQTNGILITNRLLDICSRFSVSVAVSIDGPEKVHDKFRVTSRGSGTFNNVLKGINILSSHRDAKFLNAGLLSVVDPDSDPNEIYDFFKSLNPPSVDFLYKDGNHSRLPIGKSHIGSVEFGAWMSKLFEIYLRDPHPLSIRILDDMLKALLGGRISKEGLGVTDFGIIIIDTDGTLMKNDTLKSSFNGADRFAKMPNIRQVNLFEFINSFEFSEYRKMQRPKNAKCLTCPEINVCGGGMILHRWKDDSGFDNPSVYCADQMYLINQLRRAIRFEIAQYA